MTNCSYLAEETPNVSYINSHQILHNLRKAAREGGSQGPRVVVAGGLGLDPSGFLVV